MTLKEFYKSGQIGYICGDINKVKNIIYSKLSEMIFKIDF